jgi:hypothetical protein
LPVGGPLQDLADGGGVTDRNWGVWRVGLVGPLVAPGSRGLHSDGNLL